MRLFLVILGLIMAASRLLAAGMPLTNKEISLMLRSGYSNDAIIRELSTRHFADTFDSTAEAQLTKVGAKAALLDALRSGSFQASAQEVAAAQQKLAAQEQSTKAAQEHSAASRNDADHATADAQPNPSNSAPAANAVNQVYKLLKGDLVWYRQGSIVHFDDDQLEQKKYFLFFFSANWSPTGRKFTPTLVDYYNRVTAQHPEVEVIFFSVDRSQFGMETYLSLCNMPWPAVEFSKIAAKSASMDTKLVRDIPALILVTSNGKVLSQTASGDHEKSAEQVLADLDGVLTGRQPTQVARAH